MKRLVVGWIVLVAVLGAIPSPSVAEVATCRGLPATIVGTSGDDIIVGTDGPDVIVGLGGADEIKGNAGDDIICGGRGPDVIDGGPGNDVIAGGAGADVLRGDPYPFGLVASSAADLIFGGNGPDSIWAGPDDDVVHGGRGSDTVRGNHGDDVMFGNSRSDVLVGGPGDDVARGGRGRDECAAETMWCEAAVPELGGPSVEVAVQTATFAGSVTHVEPIVSVDFALKAGPLGLWLQLDGTLGSKKVWHPATLANPGAIASDWSATIDLPGAHYSISVRATDADGDVGHAYQRPRFTIHEPRLAVGTPLTDFIYQYEDLKLLPSGTGLGRSPRDTYVDAIPADGAGEVVRLSGSLLGLIGTVQVAVQYSGTGQWLQADGTFGSIEVHHWARCFNCNDTTDGYWIFDAELPDGEYTLEAFALASWDDILVAELEPAWEFVVDDAVASSPQVSVDQSPGVEFSSSPFSFTGTAHDDIGVDLVGVGVRDPSTGMWLQNQTGPPIWDERKETFLATLADRNEVSTDWVIEFDLPPGDYRLSVAVWDEVLHRTSIRPWLPFSVIVPPAQTG